MVNRRADGARRRQRRKLREGFTTGTSAAAAAKSALHLLLTGRPLDPVPVTLPQGRILRISLHRSRLHGESSFCSVIKDGGDDPDVTHGCEIGATVRLLGDSGGPPEVLLRAGEGVGLVSKRGLPVAVGEPAINPVPRQMIEASVLEALETTATEKSVQVEVEISIPGGEALARKTLNPRLGVIGGLSLLGTTGIVRPVSHQAYRETIEAALQVARPAGDQLVLSTGGKSEKYARRLLPHLPEESFVQIGDFYRFSLRAAARLGFVRATHAVFIGKLIKMAMGIPHTHASKSNLDLEILAKIARELVGSEWLAGKLSRANTARHALEIMGETGTRQLIIPRLGAEALATSKKFSGNRLETHLFLFGYDGTILLDI